MVTKKTQESREQLYILSCIIGLVLIITLLVLCFVGYIVIVYKFNSLDSKIDTLKEDNTQINDWGQRCWTRLRTYDPNCWDPSDCSKNPKLQGCKKLDCNWCCYGSCTLMGCGWEHADWSNYTFASDDVPVIEYAQEMHCQGFVGKPGDYCYYYGKNRTK